MIATKSVRMFFTCVILGAATLTSIKASAYQTGSTDTSALHSDSQERDARYELGAVIDVRQPSPDGLTVLAITPGGAAERLGMRRGDRLRAINGHRLDGVAKPSTALASALRESNGVLRMEAMRDGKPLLLSGRADASNTPGRTKIASCGYVSSSAGVVPRSQGVFRADITQIDGRSTPSPPAYRHRVQTGKHVLVVREFIDPNRLSAGQLFQISNMKKALCARAYKSLVIDVEPGISYRIGARLLRDKLDARNIRENAYWEPVVWKQVPEACP
ncbi:MAG: PDZ domain-containing protein [Pseudoxanthomonas sp.]